MEQLGYEPTQLGHLVILGRLLAAGVLGGALGAEREQKDRQAGLRTYTLTALAACLFTIVTLEIAAGVTREEMVVADPIRVVDAVTAGVAFLAAGTIISEGKRVRGLTTGAGMWMAGAIGVACGLGYYVAALMTCAITLGALMGLRLFEDRGQDDQDTD